eukprot:1957922-Amphidinium_carterae.1
MDTWFEGNSTHGGMRGRMAASAFHQCGATSCANCTRNQKCDAQPVQVTDLSCTSINEAMLLQP